MLLMPLCATSDGLGDGLGHLAAAHVLDSERAQPHARFRRPGAVATEAPTSRGGVVSVDHFSIGMRVVPSEGVPSWTVLMDSGHCAAGGGGRLAES